jgi:hypothetical protein
MTFILNIKSKPLLKKSSKELLMQLNTPENSLMMLNSMLKMQEEVIMNTWQGL